MLPRGALGRVGEPLFPGIVLQVAVDQKADYGIESQVGEFAHRFSSGLSGSRSWNINSSMPYIPAKAG